MTDAQHNRLNQSMIALIDEVQGLRRDMAAMKAELDEMKEMSEAWQAVKLGGKFVKWGAGIAMSFAGIWYFLKAIGREVLK